MGSSRKNGSCADHETIDHNRAAHGTPAPRSKMPGTAVTTEEGRPYRRRGPAAALSLPALPIDGREACQGEHQGVGAVAAVPARGPKTNCLARASPGRTRPIRRASPSAMPMSL